VSLAGRISNQKFGVSRSEKTAGEVLAEIAAASVKYGRVETASTDHDQILYRGNHAE
jgi:hypothetical protein